MLACCGEGAGWHSGGSAAQWTFTRCQVELLRAAGRSCFRPVGARPQLSLLESTCSYHLHALNCHTSVQLIEAVHPHFVSGSGSEEPHMWWKVRCAVLRCGLLWSAAMWVFDRHQWAAAAELAHSVPMPHLLPPIARAATAGTRRP